MNYKYFIEGGDYNGRISDKEWEQYGFIAINYQFPTIRKEYFFLSKPMDPYAGHRYMFRGKAINKQSIHAYGAIKNIIDFTHYIDIQKLKLNF